MADPRELILARALIVGGSVDPSLTSYRNDPGLTEDDIPFFMLVDGSEAASDSDPAGRSAATRRHVTMAMTLTYTLKGAPSTLGASLSAIRAKAVKAILTDATLISYTANRTLRYDGADVEIVQGKSAVGQIDVNFSATYILDPTTVA